MGENENVSIGLVPDRLPDKPVARVEAEIRRILRCWRTVSSKQCLIYLFRYFIMILSDISFRWPEDMMSFIFLL